MCSLIFLILCEQTFFRNKIPKFIDNRNNKPTLYFSFQNIENQTLKDELKTIKFMLKNNDKAEENIKKLKMLSYNGNKEASLFLSIIYKFGLFLIDYDDDLSLYYLKKSYNQSSSMALTVSKLLFQDSVIEDDSNAYEKNNMLNIYDLFYEANLIYYGIGRTRNCPAAFEIIDSVEKLENYHIMNEETINDSMRNKCESFNQFPIDNDEDLLDFIFYNDINIWSCNNINRTYINKISHIVLNTDCDLAYEILHNSQQRIFQNFFLQIHENEALGDIRYYMQLKLIVQKLGFINDDETYLSDEYNLSEYNEYINIMQIRKNLIIERCHQALKNAWINRNRMRYAYGLLEYARQLDNNAYIFVFPLRIIIFIINIFNKSSYPFYLQLIQKHIFDFTIYYGFIVFAIILMIRLHFFFKFTYSKKYDF